MVAGSITFYFLGEEAADPAALRLPQAGAWGTRGIIWIFMVAAGVTVKTFKSP
jgi:hypothetical protein